MMNKGFTLLETTLCLGLVAILSLIAISGYRHTVHVQQAKSALKQTVQAISFARTQAATSGLAISICLFVEGQCRRDGRTNRLRIAFDNTDKTIKWIHLPASLHWQWKSFPVSDDLVFSGNGRAIHNGSFTTSVDQTPYRITIRKSGLITQTPKSDAAKAPAR
jgi:type IV fimbrial biogenesis protein FimT